MAHTPADDAELDAAVEAARQAVAAAAANSPHRRMHLHRLRNALWDRFDRSGDLADLSAAVEAARQLVAVTPADDPNLPGTISNLGILLGMRYHRSGDVADLNAALDGARQATALTGPDDPDHLRYLSNLWDALWDKLDESGELADLDAAVDVGREVVALASTEDPERPAYLSNLRAALHARFDRSGDAADLDAAVDAARQAVEATPVGHPRRRARVSNLGYALRARFDQSGVIADLDAAIDAWREAVEGASADDPDRPRRMSCLADAFLDRFRLTGDISDDGAASHAVGWDRWYRHQEHPEQDNDDHGTTISLFTRYFTEGGDDVPATILPAVVGRTALGAAAQTFEAAGSADITQLTKLVDLWRHIVSATPDGDTHRTARLTALGGVLRQRYETTGTLADLDAAAEAIRSALETAPSDHPDRASWLNTMLVVSYDRFERTGTTADLDAVIGALRATLDALGENHHDRGRYLPMLSRRLRERFERTRTSADLDAAIAAARAASGVVPDDQTIRTARLVELSGLLYERFRRAAGLADLDAAVEAAQEAVARADADDPERAAALSHLTVTLRERFDHTGALADLEGAVEAAQEAMTVTSGEDFRGGRLSNLASALCSRFERFGAMADINAAVDLARSAVDAVSASDARRGAILSGLGIALYVRFKRTGAPADLDAAIEAGHAAVACSAAGQPGRAEHLANLAAALIDRFSLTGAQTDLDEAIGAGESSVAESHEGDPHRAGMLCDLAISRYLRFKETGSRADLDAAIEAAQLADADVPADHPGRAIILSNLSAMLESRFRLTRAPTDWIAGLEAAEAVIEIDSAAPSIRILNARAAASLAPASQPARAADLLEAAVLLLPEVAPRQLERSDQQDALGRFAGLANDAAARALANTSMLESQRAARALRLLEAGRSVLLSQALSTRSDLTDLRARAPGLASRFSSLCDKLDQDSWANSGPAGLSRQHQLVSSGVAGDRQRLAAELATVISEIRAIDGLASFGMPPMTEELLTQAAAGPIVTFSISKHRSDALLLTKDGITCLELPGMALSAVTEQVDAFRQGLAAAADPFTGISGRLTGEARIFQVLAWLWDNAAGPVMDALGYRDTHRRGTPWPRVWWAPGGHLGQLPLHAAGHYAGQPSGDHGTWNVMNRVISSYTPTIRALGYAREQAARSRPGKSLIVAAPSVPGSRALEWAASEAAALLSFLPEPVLLADPGLTGPAGGIEAGPPTQKAVLGQLPGCSIVHFACHADTDLADPSRSRLLLADHDNAPLTVSSLAPVKLDHAQLAYLSACRTAITDNVKLIDESIHLTSAFQLAGFPHVIGTLWDIEDEGAATIASDFYKRLAIGVPVPGHLDTLRAAHALHEVTLALRGRFPGRPSLWAAYTHSGA